MNLSVADHSSEVTGKIVRLPDLTGIPSFHSVRTWAPSRPFWALPGWPDPGRFDAPAGGNNAMQKRAHNSVLDTKRARVLIHPHLSLPGFEHGGPNLYDMRTILASAACGQSSSRLVLAFPACR